MFDPHLILHTLGYVPHLIKSLPKMIHNDGMIDFAACHIAPECDISSRLKVGSTPVPPSDVLLLKDTSDTV